MSERLQLAKEKVQQARDLLNRSIGEMVDIQVSSTDLIARLQADNERKDTALRWMLREFRGEQDTVARERALEAARAALTKEQANGE